MLDDVGGREILLCASEVDEARGTELPLLVKHQADAPGAARYGLAALPASRLPFRVLGAVDAWQAMLREIRARCPLQRFPIRHLRDRLRERLEHGLRALVGGA